MPEPGSSGNERRGIGVVGFEDEAAPEVLEDGERISVAREAITINGVTIDPRKSLFVTDVAMLNGFSFARVMNQLATQSGAAGVTGLSLFRQWWDTANTSGNAGPVHCSPTFNGFPYVCPRAEGAQAVQNPFGGPTAELYKPVALVNRFDLAPTNGANCGEYRIIYARRSGETSGSTRNFVIFEAVLANPNPSTGLAGCRGVQSMWTEQSRAGRTIAQRAADLEAFYFTGLPTFLPVVHIDNYGTGANRATGQIRSDQFIQPSWNLREFKIARNASAPQLRILPVTVKTNPGGALFDPATNSVLKTDFDTFFPTQVAALARNNVNTFSMEIPERFNSGESISQTTANDYRVLFAGNSTLRTRVQAELTRIGSSLTPDDIATRATALSCAGCHQRSNNIGLGGGLTFPPSLGFVHVSENTENGPDGARFVISPALVNVFLPQRQAVMESFLSSTDPAPRCSGTSGQWDGCRGSGCFVCSEKTTNFPYYFANHPLCEKNTTCAGVFGTCNASCPAPTSADTAPAAGTCSGTSGQWQGCRGNGCAACSEKLTAFPRYFANHPRCVKNTTCAGVFGTCNDNCPAPNDSDR